jgi:hypothetical protein
MDFNIIRKRIVEQADQKKNSLLNYSKPTLVRLGSVADITAGHGGSVSDGSTPGSHPRQP